MPPDCECRKRGLVSAAVGAVPGITGRSSPPAPNAHRSRANRPGYARDAAAPFTPNGAGRWASTLSVARRAGRRRKPRESELHGRRNAKGKPVSCAKRVSRRRATMRCSARTPVANARIGCHASPPLLCLVEFVCCTQAARARRNGLKFFLFQAKSSKDAVRCAARRSALVHQHDDLPRTL